MAVLLIALALGFVLSGRSLFTLDRARTNVNQNLRSGLDIMMADVRQAGERIGSDLPAVQVDKGADADTLILRRNVLDTVLPVCVKLKAGTSTDAVFVAKKNSANTECKDKKDPGAQSALAAWEAYRVASGGTIHAFIYDPVTGDGEFFVVDATDSSQMHVHRASGKWVHDYDAAHGPRLYVLEQRAYSLDASAGLLQLEVNDGPAQNVVAGITEFRVATFLQPISAPTLAGGTGAFDGDNWRQIAFLRVTLTGEDASSRPAVQRTLVDQATPRNVLSRPSAAN
jgi:type IV pilus assembly protein PilW